MYNRLEVFKESPITYCYIPFENEVLFEPERGDFSIRDRIVRLVSSYYNVHFSDILLPRGTEDISIARKVAMKLIKDNTRLSLDSIGRHFGPKKDHSNVIHEINALKNLIATDSNLKADMELLQSKLQ